MITAQQISVARAQLAAQWDRAGMCTSCGWHALLSEHAVEDAALEICLAERNGVLRLHCQQDPGHRGIRLDLRAES